MTTNSSHRQRQTASTSRRVSPPAAGGTPPRGNATTTHARAKGATFNGRHDGASLSPVSVNKPSSCSSSSSSTQPGYPKDASFAVGFIQRRRKKINRAQSRSRQKHGTLTEPPIKTSSKTRNHQHPALRPLEPLPQRGGRQENLPVDSLEGRPKNAHAPMAVL